MTDRSSTQSVTPSGSVTINSSSSSSSSTSFTIPTAIPELSEIVQGGNVNYTLLTGLGLPIPVLLQSSCIRVINDTTVRSISIQNATSWKQDGCLLGFYCPWIDPKNDVNKTYHLDELLPQYCPPLNPVAIARMSGVSFSTPMGAFEPIVCSAGSYCPPGGAQKLTCPRGHYCPKGSYEARACSFGAYCPEASVRNMAFAPALLLLIMDTLLIITVLFINLKQRREISRSAHRVSIRIKKRARSTTPFVADAEYHAVDRESIMKKMTITRARGPSFFEELGEMEADYSIHGSFNDDVYASESTDLHLFVQSLAKCLGGKKFGLNFEFENLTFHPRKVTKPILSQVSGCINEGSLWGVMGASGAGKSTFVNVLMGKTDRTGGVTKINGVAGDIKRYKKIIGYVPQDDIVMSELTVRENILHSARIRLPTNWSDREIQHHVDILISCLQLSHVKNSQVGSPAAPIISGGQRKRVSIGMELAAAPMALFLDEPTSGLDATAAASIMSTLKALTRLGMTIVVIIHQPRQEIFESLDSLVLLGAGRMIYQGPQRGMQNHFESLGFIFPKHHNPADVMGDIIAGEGKLYKHSGDTSIVHLIDYWQQERTGQRTKDPRDSSVPIAEVEALAATIHTRGAVFYKQVYFCFVRALLQQYRLKSAFFFELGVSAIAGFLIGLSQMGSKGQSFKGIYHEPYDMLSSAISYSNVPMMALLIALAIGLTASAPGVKIFSEEKLVYWREAAAGHNRSAYYLGKVLSTFPRIALACLHFSIFFILLATPNITWGAAFLCHLLYFYCVYGLASCISMISRREDGPLLAVMASLIVGVLSGASPQLNDVRKWHLIWLWRASPGTWLGEAYFDQNITPLSYLYKIDLAKSGLGYHFDHFGLDVGMMAAIGTVYRIVAFLGLRFMYPSKQR